jgi:hypothetical protein
MKLYSEYPYASISMSKDALFVETINKIFLKKDCSAVLESGTYNGLGSTSIIAELIVKNNLAIKYFYTLEVDKEIYKAAKLNLAKYYFVNLIWGMSVNKKEAIKFINEDECINNHEKVVDVFIDSLINPKEFYLNEINGNLSNLNDGKINILKFLKDIIGPKYKENNFIKIIPKIKKLNPLIILDSSGGIGLLEFLKVRKLMANNSYYIVLDDVHHLKHFRSLQIIREDSSFKILADNHKHGWVVAKYL